MFKMVRVGVENSFWRSGEVVPTRQQLLTLALLGIASQALRGMWRAERA